MRIGIDRRTSQGDAGIAQYGQNLCRALPLVDQEDDFFVFDKEKDAAPLWESQLGFRLQVRRAKIDLLHVLGGATPVGYNHQYVLTVHDLAIYRHPEWFPDGQWFSLNLAYPMAVKLAKRIIVPSTATKADLIKLFRVKERKITVIPHGVVAPANGTGQMANGTGKRYILHVGTIEPRKNLTTLVRAFREMIDSEPELRDVELFLAGSAGWKTDEAMDEIRKTQCEGYRITLMGRVTEEEKWKLLAGAACLAFPTFYEGFGLPVLEAMAAGTPVVCSNTSSLPEVAGEAALYADPKDVGAWTRQLSEVLKNKKTADELREKGLARAKEFTWEKAAAATAKTYREALS
jgi:glycosyltransferase involved in cell wall biosynthesis